ncbi:DNA-directed RNA polymerases II 24 kDa polypeptide (RNA polymerase II subunit 5) [Entomophthora muscae]|uniref:DNA-directed RNA polymerases II 24 kDa polypeptide (RNA polymerase II subunit 5) n=1 Tax=Entomophthora muscae TaxID=34485 RepID=A0ACC2UT73_9FUNG|nr:DNA-directed RNA polymerases II 24 kDa polypeptide (RNA polymerase II subunit 5) [Entomophthora muscae]
MMEDRGFNCITKKEDDFESFMVRYAAADASIPPQALRYNAINKADPKDRAMIRFEEDVSIGIHSMKTLLTSMIEENYNSMVLIGGLLTPASKLAIKKASSRYDIQWFSTNDLIINITHHVLVPQHIPISNDEKKNLLERYHLKESQLPRIYSNDPIARYLGLKQGQVVKIVRPSESAGRSIFYRICIKHTGG